MRPRRRADAPREDGHEKSRTLPRKGGIRLDLWPSFGPTGLLRDVSPRGRDHASLRKTLAGGVGSRRFLSGLLRLTSSQAALGGMVSRSVPGRSRRCLDPQKMEQLSNVSEKQIISLPRPAVCRFASRGATHPARLHAVVLQNNSRKQNLSTRRGWVAVPKPMRSLAWPGRRPKVPT